MAHATSLTVVLYILWVLLSGHSETLLLALGAVSTLVVVIIALRMDVVDHESYPLHLTPRLPLYWLWLLWQIAKSSVTVARLTWDPALPISPRVVRVRADQVSQLGQVVYANSITLTPGTVSMTLEGNEIEVHALTHRIAQDLQTGEMGRRVRELDTAS